MKKRIKLKKNVKNKYRSQVLIVTLMLIIAVTFIFIDFVGGRVGSKMMDYTEIEVGRIARYIVNYAINSENVKSLKSDKLFLTTKNNDNEIQTVDFDSVVLNEMLNTITETIISHFKAVESGNLDEINLSDSFLINTSVNKLRDGIIMEVPIGVITDNSILANLGPRLPVRLSLSGDVETQLDTKVEYYGINNALITIYAEIKVSQQVFMPIASRRITVTQKIPIAIKLMQGIVPNCYFGNLKYSSLPTE